jgi:hypothetical protein
VPASGARDAATWARIAAARALQLVLGLALLYFSLPMFSSAGLRQPNVGVWVALLCIGLLTVSASRAEGHPVAGLWAAVLAYALPAALLSLPGLGKTPCPSNPPPITNTYSCVFPGYPALLAFALVLILSAIAGAILDMRALLARAGRASTEQSF